MVHLRLANLSGLLHSSTAKWLMPPSVAWPRWFAPYAGVDYVLESALQAIGYLRRSTDNWRSPTAFTLLKIGNKTDSLL